MGPSACYLCWPAISQSSSHAGLRVSSAWNARALWVGQKGRGPRAHWPARAADAGTAGPSLGGQVGAQGPRLPRAAPGPLHSSTRRPTLSSLRAHSRPFTSASCPLGVRLGSPLTCAVTERQWRTGPARPSRLTQKPGWAWGSAPASDPPPYRPGGKKGRVETPQHQHGPPSSSCGAPAALRPLLLDPSSPSWPSGPTLLPQLEGDDFTPAESRIQQHTVFT